MRVGIGYDIHRFRADGDGALRLGGIEIKEAPCLDGHSDGDALIHAIIDALLGAAGEGDIGKHFPPGDPSTKGIDSRELLKRVHRLISARGYGVNNLDATVVAERPRLAVFKSLKYIYAQLIDDIQGVTLAQASSREASVLDGLKSSAGSRGAARKVGELIASRAKEKGVERVVFDRGGFIYHGKIREVAEGARAQGLEF